MLGIHALFELSDRTLKLRRLVIQFVIRIVIKVRIRAPLLAMPFQPALQMGFSPCGAASSSNPAWADEYGNWAASLTRRRTTGLLWMYFVIP
jgi:hypothetical protein